MKSQLKIFTVIVGFIFGLSACAPIQAQAPQSEATSQRIPTQITIPKDKEVAVAMNEAMPTIKKILSIHRCLTNSDGLRQMNIYAVPGVDMKAGHDDGAGGLRSGSPMVYYMEYHDQSKCVSVQAIDQWSMPALNALFFRVVYFADDSGETVNFTYVFKKVDDGSWKILGFEQHTH